MSGRDEQPKRKRRDKIISVDHPPYQDDERHLRRRDGPLERNPFDGPIIPLPTREEGEPEINPEVAQRLRDLMDGMAIRTPEEQTEMEEIRRMRAAIDVERVQMQEVFQDRARILADEMIEFIRVRPEIYTLPMIARGFVAVAQMLDVNAPLEVYNIAAIIASSVLNQETEDDEGEDFGGAMRRSENRFVPPVPTPEVMAEMMGRLPVDRDIVITFVNERPEMYPAPIEATTILAVIELLGIEGPSFYTRLLLVDVMRTLYP